MSVCETRNRNATNVGQASTAHHSLLCAGVCITHKRNATNPVYQPAPVAVPFFPSFFLKPAPFLADGKLRTSPYPRSLR
jgi:hypothetical protein